jgi:hypothetical protein
MLSPKHAVQHTKNIELQDLGLLELLRPNQGRSQIATHGARVWITRPKLAHATSVLGSERLQRVFGMSGFDESSQLCTLGCELVGFRPILNSRLPRLCEMY